MADFVRRSVSTHSPLPGAVVEIADEQRRHSLHSMVFGSDEWSGNTEGIFFSASSVLSSFCCSLFLSFLSCSARTPPCCCAARAQKRPGIEAGGEANHSMQEEGQTSPVRSIVGALQSLTDATVHVFPSSGTHRRSSIVVEGFSLEIRKIRGGAFMRSRRRALHPMADLLTPSGNLSQAPKFFLLRLLLLLLHCCCCRRNDL